ncbi:carbohydrate ABC transporter permease [Dictyobacter kobayashii]|uniref:Sugar ABC transporter permease n=1 Tax=Dictyobacter kobayashii TaxID=2014872 RepID=A0A402ADK0_9CHLR|nr:sugar ABC transporter permease [Dictyobacter kobayashii]GCE17122.1 sugar ABC transporter permease [Dictyobacter kobayashii]
MYGKGWSRAVPYLCFLPGLLLYVVITLGPSLATTVFSFTDISGTPNTPWHFIGLANYSEYLFGSNARDNLAAFQRTIIFCISVTLIQNGVALFLAVLLNQKIKGSTFFRTLIFLPTVLGVTVIGLVWTIIFNPINGPVEQFLHLLNQNSPLLGSFNLAFPLVIFVQIWSSVGFAMVIYLAGVQTIPAELIEAARIDGGRPWQVFWLVTFPLLASFVTINVLLSIISSLQSYQLIYVLTGGGNGNVGGFNTSVLSLQIFSSAFSQGMRQGYASALAVLQFLLVLIIALIAQIYLRRREVQL